LVCWVCVFVCVCVVCVWVCGVCVCVCVCVVCVGVCVCCVWVCVWCVCSLGYQACNTHTPYFHLWPAALCNVCIDFLYKFYLKHFLFEEEMNKIWSKMSPWSFVNLPVIVEFSGQFFEKYSYMKFHENSSIVSRVVTCGMTDGRT